MSDDLDASEVIEAVFGILIFTTLVAVGIKVLILIWKWII